ncbi:recombinase family protein [Nocardia brevicatena]|uniref:recombinase family protein n=1 Tax=Nocardia brevicatena TaxID=37327 RepID=UPI000301BB4C|nr:recombinase family protein [Nocardia brevicatena]
MNLGYARVSTTHQDLERQLVALAEHGIPDDRIYADKKTSATIDRPEFTKMLKYAREGDTIVATNLDRLGRNLRECLNVIHDLSERGIGVRTLRDPLPIDTTDTSGMAELSVAMLALFAHMERVFMRERAAHAREVAANQGKQPGRPRKLTPAQLAMARAALREDQSVAQVAEVFGVSRATFYRYLAEDADAQQDAGEPKEKKWAYLLEQAENTLYRGGRRIRRKSGG